MVTSAPSGVVLTSRSQEPAGGALVRSLWTCAVGLADVQLQTTAGVLSGHVGKGTLAAEAMASASLDSSTS